MRANTAIERPLQRNGMTLDTDFFLRQPDWVYRGPVSRYCRGAVRASPDRVLAFGGLRHVDNCACEARPRAAKRCAPETIPRAEWPTHREPCSCHWRALYKKAAGHVKPAPPRRGGTPWTARFAAVKGARWPARLSPDCHKTKSEAEYGRFIAWAERPRAGL